eukprot:g2264.t1
MLESAIVCSGTSVGAALYLLFPFKSLDLGPDGAKEMGMAYHGIFRLYPWIIVLYVAIKMFANRRFMLAKKHIFYYAIPFGLFIVFMAYYRTLKGSFIRTTFWYVVLTWNVLRTPLTYYCFWAETNFWSQKDASGRIESFSSVVISDLQHFLDKNREILVDYFAIAFGDKIGSGATSDVFLGSYQGKRVAIKVYTPDNITLSLLRSFADEINLMRPLLHRNVATVSGLSVMPPNIVVVLPLYEGGDLKFLLNDQICRKALANARRAKRAAEIKVLVSGERSGIDATVSDASFLVQKRTSSIDGSNERHIRRGSITSIGSACTSSISAHTSSSLTSTKFDRSHSFVLDTLSETKKRRNSLIGIAMTAIGRLRKRIRSDSNSSSSAYTLARDTAIHHSSSPSKEETCRGELRNVAAATATVAAAASTKTSDDASTKISLSAANAGDKGRSGGDAMDGPGVISLRAHNDTPGEGGGVLSVPTKLNFSRRPLAGKHVSGDDSVSSKARDDGSDECLIVDSPVTIEISRHSIDPRDTYVAKNIEGDIDDATVASMTLGVLHRHGDAKANGGAKILANRSRPLVSPTSPPPNGVTSKAKGTKEEEVGQDDNTTASFLSGPISTLATSMFDEDGVMTWRSRIEMAVDLCSALAYLHTRSTAILHRDVKPANILLDSALNIKLADFGESCFVGDEIGTDIDENSDRWQRTKLLEQASSRQQCIPIAVRASIFWGACCLPIIIVMVVLTIMFTFEPAHFVGTIASVMTACFVLVSILFSLIICSGMCTCTRRNVFRSICCCCVKDERLEHLSLSIRGSPMWMSPEILGGKHNRARYGTSADVFSTAIVIWQILSLEPLYPKKSLFDIIRGVTKGDLRPEIPKGWSQDIRSMLTSAWSDDPTKRPSAKEMKRTLRRELKRTDRAHDGSSSDSLFGGLLRFRSSSTNEPLCIDEHSRSPFQGLYLHSRHAGD